MIRMWLLRTENKNLLKMKGAWFSPDRLAMTKATDEGVSKVNNQEPL